MIKKVITSIIFIILIISFAKISYASDDLILDAYSGAKDFLKESEDVNGASLIKEASVTSVSSIIHNTLLSITVVVAVITSGIMGIRFMIGSVAEKSEVKESLVPFVVGCVVVFGGFGVWRIFIEIGNRVIS